MIVRAFWKTEKDNVKMFLTKKIFVFERTNRRDNVLRLCNDNIILCIFRRVFGAVRDTMLWRNARHTLADVSDIVGVAIL